MKRVKTFFAVCIITALTFVTAYGQDMEAATELYNAGGKALSESNYVAAIDSFNKALKMLETLTAEDRGDDGDALIVECKNIIPQIHLRYGKELATSGEIDNAIVQLKKAGETAKSYSMPEVADEAEGLIPQLLMVNATNLLNGGKLPEAIAGFKKVIVADPSNANAYLYIGLAESRLNNEDAAIVAFEKAIELGEITNSPRQISTIYLKRSVAATRDKKWADVFSNAKKANEYSESANGFKLIGLAGVQLKRYDEAIDALESYLAADPDAKDKSSTIYNLAVSYEAKNNNAKACGYYKQLLNDATYKQVAEFKVKTTLKCN
ncbi:MAG: tetratricopeptide repeat protein [Bacteroidales bacterium]|jgi:tetratricopeptide (TPR) repeat protein|nr:tetratricopeptide repeat protein [Bacteroidales bacterium]